VTTSRLPSRIGVPTLFLALFPALFLALPPAPAGASGVTVSVQDFSFTPSTVTVGLGQAVTWQFHSMHTSTSNQRFWDSGIRSSGGYVVTFVDAGSFAYHCSMHPSMTGRVRVRMTASGSASDGWRLRWSARTSTPASRRFDVRFKKAGASRWTTFRKATAKRSGRFDPAGAGSYLVKSRTRNVGVGKSGWSPALTVRVS
jgi:plastocyanin